MIFEKYNETTIIIASFVCMLSTIACEFIADACASAVFYDMTTCVTISLALPVCSAGPG